MNESDKQKNPSQRGSKTGAGHASASRDAAEAAPATPDVDVAPTDGQDPVEFSGADEPGAAVSEDPELVQTRQQLDAARKRVDELARAYQALTQDKEEFKARLTRERDRMIEVEKGNVAQVLLDAIDQLELSINASGSDTSALAQGVKMIRDGLLQKVQGLGLERIPVTGRPYDPNTAEAVDMEITAEPEQDGVVVAELRGGYRMKDRIIRPARVKVAKYVKPADA